MATRTALHIFDDGLGELGPMTDLRASFEVRTGMLTTAGRIAANRAEALGGYWVPARLATVVAERANAAVNELGPDDERVLCVNGRWAAPEGRRRIPRGAAIVEAETGHVVAACLDRADAETFLRGGATDLPDGLAREVAPAGTLYRYPWHVVSRFEAAITGDIAATRLLDAEVPGAGAAIVGEHPIEVHATARLYPNIVLDAERGPIRIHPGAVIRPGAIVCGPCSVGRDATVVDRAHIKPSTVIGPVCKVGGEVGSTIFQGYSNKAHDGHLGDSWVGKWVNIGAGTTSSNLLNTYGEITMRLGPEGPVHRTGVCFLGALVGDHVKLAIETRLMTGSVIGTGAMVATTAPVPQCVPRFAWLTNRGEHVFRFAKFIETARAMMARRGRQPTAAYVAALEALHPSN